MFKRLGVLVLAFVFILAILPVFYVFADESALALYTISYQVSSDNGSTWQNRSSVLNYEDSITIQAGVMLKITGLTIQKQSNNFDDLYFIIKSPVFYNNTYNVNNNNVIISTFYSGLFGYLAAGTDSYNFIYNATYGPYTSGTTTFTFDIFDNLSYDSFFEIFQSWLAQIGDNLDSFYADWSSSFLPHFDNIWQILSQTNYTYLSFAGHGGGLTSAVVKNPLLAINGQLSALVRYFNKIQKNDYSYDSISYDSDGIGSTTVVSNVPWFDAMLGQLKGSSAIEQHHMEMENEALDAGANDVYQGALDSAGTSWGVLSDISGIYQIGSPQTIPVGYQDALTAGLNWYSVENRTILTAPETPGDPDMRFSIFDLDKNRSIVFGGDNSDPG